MQLELSEFLKILDLVEVEFFYLSEKNAGIEKGW